MMPPENTREYFYQDGIEYVVVWIGFALVSQGVEYQARYMIDGR